VTFSPEAQGSLPEWARGDSFPKSRPGWGWLDLKNRPHEASSEEALINAIREDKAADVALVWTPDHEFMVLPEELEAAADALISSREVRIKADHRVARVRLLWMSLLLAAYVIYRLLGALPDVSLWEGLQMIASSSVVGFGLLVLLIFGLIPWYQSRKRLGELQGWGRGDTAALVPLLKFETWLDLQKAPVTKCLMGLVVVVGLLQLLPSDSIIAAGLVKPSYFQGEWWRLLTYSLLHGNLIHFTMNALALLYLGKRVEVFAKWPHLLTVFIFASLLGGECSARLLDAPTVGASGGLMGWLGFLLVFESLHQRLVPQSARRLLLAGLLLTALIGVIGYRFIDNAVHAGGLFAGIIYAALVFIKSSSVDRPRVMWVDRVAGGFAAAVLLVSAWIAGMRILGIGF